MIRNCFSEDSCSSENRLDGISPDVTNKKANTVKVVTPEKFKNDIKALEDYVGDKLTSGLSIRMSLQEILSVIPRNRHRADAYNSLIKYLRDEMGIELNIEGRNKQTKKGEGNEE